jgi:hypothetical protein
MPMMYGKCYALLSGQKAERVEVTDAFRLFDSSLSLRFYFSHSVLFYATLQREVSTSSTWDGGCLYGVEPLDHSQYA